MRSGEDLTIYHKINFAAAPNNTEYSDMLKKSLEDDFNFPSLLAKWITV